MFLAQRIARPDAIVGARTIGSQVIGDISERSDVGADDHAVGLVGDDGIEDGPGLPACAT